MIPKTIHYCWFGGNPIPDELKRCMETWSILLDDGWELVRWDETNCSFAENEFVSRAYREKKYGFVPDYYRMKVLRDYGGVYLDVDTVVRRNPGALFDNASFVCGFIVDCCVHTHVLGGEKGCALAEQMVDLYDRTVFVEAPLPTQLVFEDDGRILSNGLTTSNYYLTRLMLDEYPNFMLNGSRQEFAPGYFIYEKEFFSTGDLLNREYFFDMSYGSWRQDKQRHRLIKRLLSGTPLYYSAQKMVRNYRACDIKNHVFYPEYNAQISNKDKNDK